MKAFWVGLAAALALTLQAVAARMEGSGPTSVDFMLVVVISAGLLAGPVTGLFTGTVGGLVQDALSSGVLGIGGLAKTSVGFVVGVVARQFIVAEPVPRLVVFFGATLLHALVFVGLYEVLGLRDFGVPITRTLAQAAVNAIVGVVALELVELAPSLAERRRGARSWLRR